MGCQGNGGVPITGGIKRLWVLALQDVVNVTLMVGLDGPNGVFQSKWFYDFVVPHNRNSGVNSKKIYV